MRFALICFILMMASSLRAGILVSYTSTPLSGGLVAYDIYLQDDTNNPGVWFAQEWSFTGNIQQTLAFGSTVVSKESDAILYNSIPGSGYVLLQDTWVGSAWTNFPPPSPNPLDQLGTFSFSAGTDAANKVATVLLAHIVADGPVQYSGLSTKSGLTAFVPASGVLVVPEPSTIICLISGLICAGVYLVYKKS